MAANPSSSNSTQGNCCCLRHEPPTDKWKSLFQVYSKGGKSSLKAGSLNNSSKTSTTTTTTQPTNKPISKQANKQTSKQAIQQHETKWRVLVVIRVSSLLIFWLGLWLRCDCGKQSGQTVLIFWDYCLGGCWRKF